MVSMSYRGLGWLGTKGQLCRIYFGTASDEVRRGGFVRQNRQYCSFLLLTISSKRFITGGIYLAALAGVRPANTGVAR